MNRWGRKEGPGLSDLWKTHIIQPRRVTHSGSIRGSDYHDYAERPNAVLSREGGPVLGLGDSRETVTLVSPMLIASMFRTPMVTRTP